MCTKKRKEIASNRIEVATKIMTWRPSLRCNLQQLPNELFAAKVSAAPCSTTVKFVDVVENPFNSAPLANDLQSAIIFLITNDSFEDFIGFVDECLHPSIKGVLPELVSEPEPIDDEAVAVVKLKAWHKHARQRIECEIVGQYMQTRGSLGDPIWHILQTRFGGKYNDKQQLLALTQNTSATDAPTKIEFTVVDAEPVE